MLTRNKTRIKNSIYILILAVIVVLGIIIQSPGRGFLWASPVTSHKSSTDELWSHTGIYMGANSQSLMTASNNKLIVMGSRDVSQKSSIMAFEGNSGNMIWQVAYNGISIASTSSKVIAGGAGKVTALNQENGEVLWSTIVQANVTRIIPKDNRLYIYAASGGQNYILDVENGNVMEKYDGTYTSEQEPSLGNIAYLYDGNGDVFAVNKSNGHELWRRNADIISNLAISPSFVYALSQDGNLLQFDANTGNNESLVMFTPTLFLHSEQTITFPYYVTVDIQTNTLFVYLGDSVQLFAFHIQ